MTGLRKFTAKDLGAIVDAAERYSVGLDDLFTDYIPMEWDLSNKRILIQSCSRIKFKWRIEVALAGWRRIRLKSLLNLTFF